MARIKQLEGKNEIVRLEEAQYDESYQRGDKVSQKFIEENFDRAAVSTPQLARRGSQGLFVIDGRQRIEVMKRLGITHWRCNVIESSGPVYEAHLFRLINGPKGKKALNTRELFRAALTAQDQAAIGVKTIVEKNNLKLGLAGHQKEHPFIRCVGILYKTYQTSDGERILDRALSLIDKCWPGSVDGLHETIIGAVAMFIRGREFDEDYFIKMVGSVPAKTVRQEAPSGIGTNRHVTCADHMIILYNRKFRAGSKNALRLFKDKAPVEEEVENLYDKDRKRGEEGLTA